MRSIVLSSPAPDPYPTGRTAVSYVAYSFVAGAVDRRTGRRLAGEWFRCWVSVSGKRFCVLFRAAD
jgi:hypothetical protein